MQPVSLQPASPVRRLKLIVLAATGALVLLFPALGLVGLRFEVPAIVWLALPLILGCANLVLVPAVGSTVRPLPHGVTPERARRISFDVLRTVTVLRFALAESPAVFGVVAAVAGGSLLPYAIGFAFSVPLLMLLVYPHDSVVGALRQRLESGGVSSHLAD
jgi:hypothetical protein